MKKLLQGNVVVEMAKDDDGEDVYLFKLEVSKREILTLVRRDLESLLQDIPGVFKKYIIDELSKERA